MEPMVKIKLTGRAVYRHKHGTFVRGGEYMIEESKFNDMNMDMFEVVTEEKKKVKPKSKSMSSPENK